MSTIYVVSRQATPHLRCGICDETIQSGEPTGYVDDERVHIECAEDPEARYELDRQDETP